VVEPLCSIAQGLTSAGISGVAMVIHGGRASELVLSASLTVEEKEEKAIDNNMKETRSVRLE
jgi:hypothetical protein